MLNFSGGGIVPGVSRARSVTGDPDLPRAADVVVVGGGIVGCMTALHLAERNLDVVLCEKGVIAGEASGRAAGLLEYQHLAPIKMELVARSLELWRGMAERIGADIGYAGRGVVTLYDHEADAAAAGAWLEAVRGRPGVDARILPGAQVQQLDSELGSGWKAALLQANGAAVEPRLAAPAIAQAARAKGAKVVQHCAVRGFGREAGKITAVVTERGTIQTGTAVIAGGAWSPGLAQPLGLKLPQILIYAEMLSVEPLRGGPALPGMAPAGYFRREPDGGYMFGTATGVVPITPTLVRNLSKLRSVRDQVDQQMMPVFNAGTFWRELRAGRPRGPTEASVFERHRILQPEFLGATATDTFEGMRKQIPAFANSVVRERYAGALMASLDNLGVISSVQRIPGLYLGTGMLYGLTMAAAAGEALADLITGERPKFDITPYRYERFADGSRFEFHA